ncbi:MAG: hypothetical protein ACHP84_01035 [Caulobacterales bacterium]
MLAVVALGFAAHPAAAIAQTLGQAAASDVPWLRVGAALAFCLALAVGGAFALRWRLRGGIYPLKGSVRRLQLVETVRLSHQIDVCLLKLDERHILVAAGPHGATLLMSDAAAPIDRP